MNSCTYRRTTDTFNNSVITGFFLEVITVNTRPNKL